MKTGLEEQMKTALDAASLEDILPGFDMDDTWSSLQSELPGQKEHKRTIFLGWVKYAAAILLVMLGIYGAMQLSAPTKAPVVTTSKNIPANNISLSNARPVPATPVIAQPNAAPAVAATEAKKGVKPTHATTMPEARLPEIAPIPKPLPAPEIAMNNTVVTAPVAVAKGAPKKVIHYLDLDPEIPLAAPAQNVAATPFIRMKLNKPGISAGNAQPKPFKELVLALSK